MWRFTLRRFLIMIPQLFILSIIIFIVAQMMPGDPLTGMIDPNMSTEMIAEIRAAQGWNDPWYVQYWNWIVGIVTRGDFGRSWRHQMPVAEIIGQRAGNTLRLSFFSLVLSYIIAIPLGIIAGRYHETWKDKLITFYTYIAFAMPVMLLALLLILTFGFNLRWFPTGGSVAVGMTPDMGLTYWWSRLQHMILPGLAVAIVTTVGVILYLRGEIVDMKQKEFIIAVRAKGATEKLVYNKHILRNSLLPIASFLGFQVAGLIGGSILIESLFSYPGIGGLFMTSISGRDYSVMVALVLLFGATTIVGSFLSDLVMMVVDPRVEIE